jgi:hypothetical protein
VFYQPSTLSHILPAFVKTTLKHLILDIVVFEYWRELYKLIEQRTTPKLFVGVKTGDN